MEAAPPYSESCQEGELPQQWDKLTEVGGSRRRSQIVRGALPRRVNVRVPPRGLRIFLKKNNKASAFCVRLGTLSILAIFRVRECLG